MTTQGVGVMVNQSESHVTASNNFYEQTSIRLVFLSNFCHCSSSDEMDYKSESTWVEVYEGQKATLALFQISEQL